VSEPTPVNANAISSARTVVPKPVNRMPMSRLPIGVGKPALRLNVFPEMGLGPHALLSSQDRIECRAAGSATSPCGTIHERSFSHQLLIISEDARERLPTSVSAPMNRTPLR